MVQWVCGERTLTKGVLLLQYFVLASLLVLLLVFIKYKKIESILASMLIKKINYNLIDLAIPV